MSFSPNDIGKEVSKELLGYEDNVYISMIEQWINEALDDILYECRWNFNVNTVESITTVAGDVDYEVAATVGEATSMRDSDDEHEIYFQRREDLVEAGADLELQGIPYYFYPISFNPDTEKWTFGLYPVPNQTYNLQMFNNKKIGVISSTATIPLPYAFRGTLKQKVLSRAYAIDGQPECAEYYIREHYTQLEKRRTTEQSKPAEKRYKAIQDLPSARSSGPRLPSNYPR